MRLVTFVSVRSTMDRLGVLVGDDQVLDLSAAAAEPAFASMLALIEAGEGAWERARKLTRAAPAQHRMTLADVRLRAPIPLPPQIRDCMAFLLHIKQSALGRVRAAALASGDPKQMAAYEATAASFEVPAIYRRQPVYYKANRFAVS